MSLRCHFDADGWLAGPISSSDTGCAGADPDTCPQALDAASPRCPTARDSFPQRATPFSRWPALHPVPPLVLISRVPRWSR